MRRMAPSPAPPPTHAESAPKAPVPVAAAPKKSVKLSYKDARRLEEVEKLMETLPVEIAKQDAILADQSLYTRDPAAFDRAMKAADKARADLEAAELDWLELEEKKAALAG